MSLSESMDSLSRVCSVGRRLLDALKEELEPPLPVTLKTNIHEVFEVLRGGFKGSLQWLGE